MSEYKNIARTVLLSQLKNIFRFLETGSRDHKFGATNIFGTLDDFIQIIFMSFLAMVDTSEDRVAKIYSNLWDGYQFPRTEVGCIAEPTSAYFSRLAESMIVE